MTAESGQLRGRCTPGEAVPAAVLVTTHPAAHLRPRPGRPRLRLVPPPLATVGAEWWSGAETKECS